MDWLDPDTLDAIYEAAVAADLVDRDTRTVLLQGIDDDLRLSLPDHARPDLQFRSDLRLLNRQPPGATAPLKAWLAEAAHLAEGRPQARVFVDALGRAAADGPSASPDDPPGSEPPSIETPAEARPAWFVPAAIGAAVLLVGVLVALAVGDGPSGPDAGPPDAGSTVLRPLAVKVADASRGRPALYRIGGGTVALEDVAGPRTITVDQSWAWSRGPITAAQFAAITGGLPPGREADDTPISGLSARTLRTFCDGLSRSEGLQPFYADGGPGYRLPPEDAWVFTCVGGRGGSPAPASWGLAAFDGAETMAEGAEGTASLVERGGQGGVGIGACTAGRRPLGDGPAPGFRVVRPLERSVPLTPIPR